MRRKRAKTPKTPSSKIPPEAVFLTPRQIASQFQVKELTVRIWLRRGLLKGIKIGHSWRVARRVVEEFSGEGGDGD